MKLSLPVTLESNTFIAAIKDLGLSVKEWMTVMPLEWMASSSINQPSSGASTSILMMERRAYQHARILFGMGNELADRLHRQRRVDDQHGGRPHHAADRHEAQLAPLDARLHSRIGNERRADERPGVAVRVRLRHLVPGEVAVRAGLRLVAMMIGWCQSALSFSVTTRVTISTMPPAG